MNSLQYNYLQDSPAKLWPLPKAVVAYLLTLDVLIVALGLLVWSQGYLGSFLILNGSWGAAFDWLMPNLTHVGDAVILSSLVVLVFWRRNPSMVLSTLLALIVTGIIVQLLKRQVFPDWHRPIHFFENHPNVLLLLKHNERHNSMPSGHTLSLFGAGFGLAWLMSKTWMGIAWAVLLSFVAFTRVYIGAHFPADVLVGLLLGTAGSALTVSLTYGRIRRWWQGLGVKSIRYISLTFRLLGVILLTIGVLNRYFDILAVN